MPTTPSAVQMVMEVEASTIGDQAPTPVSGSLEIFPNQNGAFYKKTSAGVVSALIPGVTSVSNADGTLTVSPTTGVVVASRAAITGGVTVSAGSNVATVVTNANLTGGVTSVGNAATVVTNANLTGGVTSVGNAATVVTNANLTGPVTSVGNATTIVATGVGAGGPTGSTSVVPVISYNAAGQLTAVTTATITPAAIAAVPTTRNVNTTAPITGGGALSADLTLALTTSPAGQTPVGVTRTITATSPIQIDGGTSADLSANRTLSILPATTALPGSLAAIDKRYLDDQRVGRVNLLDYAGATIINTGVNSCETALTAAIAALPAAGGIVDVPAGSYLITSTPYVMSHDQLILNGLSPGTTAFVTASTTGDILRFTGYGSGIQNCAVQGPGSGTTSSKSAGIGVDIQGTEGFCDNVQFTYHFDSLRLGGALVDARNLVSRYFNRNGIVVDHQSDHRITTVLMNNNAATLPTGGGIRVTQAASLVLEQLNIIASNFALDIAPAIGITVPSVKATDCFFDTSAVGLNMQTAGSMLRCEFTNCWFSSMSVAGIRMDPAASGQVDGVTFVNCDIYNNVGGTTNGVIAGALVKKWKMIGCSIAGWTNGINLTAGSGHFPTIIGNTIGAVSAFGVNGTGIVVGAGAYKGLVISGNDVVDNTAAISLGAATFTVPANYRITDNAGINPRGSITPPIAVPVTATTYTNATGFRCAVEIRWVTTNTQHTVNGVNYGTGPVNLPRSVTLEPGATIATSGTGTASWFWSAM